MGAYAELDGVDLVALAGREPDRLTKLGTTYAIARDRLFDDWTDLIAHGELDVISVATPTALHHPAVIAALDAGLHVLSEKPIADNAAKAREMVAAAERNDRVLDVAFNHRNRGDVKELKKIVDSGVLGQVYYAKAGWLRREGIPTLGSWFTRRATAGGGPLMDIGVHMLDMVLHVLGEPAVQTATAATYAVFGPRGRGASPSPKVRKTGVTEAPFDVEDLSTAFLRLSGGATLLLESSWAQWIPEDQCYVRLYGSDGGASIEWADPTAPERRMSIWTERGERIVAPAEMPPDGGHRECVLDFLEHVEFNSRGDTPRAPRGRGNGASHRGWQALARAEVVDACYASAESGREVELA
jgi:predicted dehydrogenase